MAYTNLSFCWHGIISTDTDAAIAFYTEVLGWQHVRMAMGDDEASMMSAGGVPRLHVSGPNMEGEPSHWSDYLRVADVDAATKACVAAGGKVIVPGTDIAPGRFSAVASPSGAIFCLFHEANYDQSQDAPAGPGAIHWTELHSTDLDADVAWLKASFGFSTSPMKMPGGTTYHILMSGDRQVGGAMKGMHEGAPSMWLSWVQVEDVDATAARVSQHGGKLLSEAMDMPGVGRMVVAQDPTGGVFGIITPS